MAWFFATPAGYLAGAAAPGERVFLAQVGAHRTL